MKLAAAFTSLLLLILALTGARLQYQGNLYWQFMVSDFFGVPAHLKDQYQPWFHKPDLGWDGQFHFHIAQDLLNRKNTAPFIDNPSYRYRRIGLPLWARATFFFISPNEVKPWQYLFAHALFIFFALSTITSYLIQRGLSPWWILGWTLSAGTVTTFIHGLPDPMADAGMVAGFVAYLQRRPKLSAFFFVFAALSREYTVLIPCGIFVYEFVCTQLQNKSWNKLNFWYLLAPLTMTIWHAYVRFFIGTLDPQTYFFVLDWPLHQIILRLIESGNKLGVAVVLSCIFPIFYFLFKTKDSRLIVFFPIVLLTLSTGPVVWVYYRDAIKTFSYILLLAPILLSFQNEQMQRKLRYLSIFAFMIHFAVLVKIKKDEFQNLPRTCQACLEDQIDN